MKRIHEPTHACASCARPPVSLPASTCAYCGGVVDVVYDLTRVELHRADDPLVRYRELLPCDVGASHPGIALVPTPCSRARSLGATVGLTELFIKDETTLPTGTTKDRIACVALPYLFAHGVRRFATTSTGNTSTAFARLLEKLPGLEMVVFTPEEFLERVHHVGGPRMIHFVLAAGSYDDAMVAVRDYERAHGLRPEGGFFNPGRREGLKLAFFEAVDRLETSFDWYVQAVSSAMGVYGCYKGAKELRALGRLDRLPRLLGVQQRSCAPMARAFQRGAERIDAADVIANPRGLASAILLGDPTAVYPHVARVVRESGGTMVAVDDDAIRDAQRALLEHEGIRACASASAAVAGVLACAREGLFAPGERILLNVSGGERTPAVHDAGALRWLERGSDGWRARAFS